MSNKCSGYGPQLRKIPEGAANSNFTAANGVNSLTDMPHLVNPVPPTAYPETPTTYPDPTVDPLIPRIFPNNPEFQVPANPLLPPGYQEILSYEALQYMNGFLRTQIGRFAQVDFLVGSNTLVTKTGMLVGVGLNYILLQEAETSDVILCDFYNIKFVKFYY